VSLALYRSSAVSEPSTPELPGDSRRWYAIRIQSKLEGLASATLRGKGYEEFLPLYRSRRRWSDRVKQLDLPCSPATCSAASPS